MAKRKKDKKTAAPEAADENPVVVEASPPDPETVVGLEAATEAAPAEGREPGDVGELPDEGTYARHEAAEPELDSQMAEGAAESGYIADEEILNASPQVEPLTAVEDAEVVVDSDLITDLGEIESVLEAIIFAAPKAISTLKLKNLLRAFSYDVSVMNDVLESMIQRQDGRGFQLVKVGGGYQYRTHPKHADVMQKMLEDRPAKLSPSALEVLSIVAYKQPITRAEIDSVRGVDSGHLMKGLLEKNLIRTLGHAETAGRPMLYGSAPYFLEVFGLNSLDDLPALDEMNRELVNDPNAGVDSDDAMQLSSGEGGLDSSGLAANPDRGEFDAPTEEVFEQPDFGAHERALEN